MIFMLVVPYNIIYVRDGLPIYSLIDMGIIVYYIKECVRQQLVTGT